MPQDNNYQAHIEEWGIQAQIKTTVYFMNEVNRYKELNPKSTVPNKLLCFCPFLYNIEIIFNLMS